jgi:hypothetical protein
MTKYQRGGHIKCKVTMSTDPTDLTLKIYDSLNELKTTVEKASLTHPSTGVYTYNYLIPEDGALGDWKYEYTAETSAISIETKYFTVDLFDSLLYCTTSSVFRKTGIEAAVVGEDDVADYILEAMGEIDSLYQRSFGNAQTKTQWIDIEDLDDDEEIATIFLDYRPVQSITSVVSYDTTDTIAVTWTASDYWADLGTGIIRLRTKKFSHQNNRVKVIYTYGYSTVPANIKNLTATICAMRILIQQIGGTYDDVTSYSMPSGVSIGVGEPYMNMTRAIEKLEKEKKTLIKNIGQLRTTVLVI